MAAPVDLSADMDLSTGPGLVAAVSMFLDKADLAGKIPGFVRLAEARFNRELRARDQIRRVTADTQNEWLALPSDLAEAKSLKITAPADYAGPLEYQDPSTIAEYNAEGQAIASVATVQAGPFPAFRLPGGPRYYTISGDAIELAPVPRSNVTIEMTYYQRVPALDLTTPGATNWLLTKAPDLYLYASLMAAAPFLVEDERLPVWTTLAKDALDSINAEAAKTAASGGRLNARRRTFG